MSSRKSKRKVASTSGNFENSGFSPIDTGKHSVHGNLTGNARIVKDASADWHNLIQKWNSLNAAGVDVVNRIANCKLQHVMSLDDESLDKDDMPSEMLGLFETLEMVFQKMEKIVKKMSSLTTSLKGVCDLVHHQSGDEHSMASCLFQTWPVSKFYETSDELLCAYTQELKLKKSILENIAHVKDRSLMMFCSASWLHQPYIDDKCAITLESMQLETGHR